MKLRILPRALELQVDRDHRLQRQSHRDRVDVGIEPADDAEVYQPANAAVTRRGRDPDRLRERVVGHSSIAVQLAQDPAVHRIEISRPKILRQVNQLTRLFR